ncbi:hypothetical protein GF357_00765 [Candidatus Dojkabacteria bacterium]|nr:hypothetical protein [Candidatus Dojkabacteria bacterium]
MEGRIEEFISVVVNQVVRRRFPEEHEEEREVGDEPQISNVGAIAVWAEDILGEHYPDWKERATDEDAFRNLLQEGGFHDILGAVTYLLAHGYNIFNLDMPHANYDKKLKLRRAILEYSRRELLVSENMLKMNIFDDIVISILPEERSRIESNIAAIMEIIKKINEWGVTGVSNEEVRNNLLADYHVDLTEVYVSSIRTAFRRIAAGRELSPAQWRSIWEYHNSSQEGDEEVPAGLVNVAKMVLPSDQPEASADGQALRDHLDGGIKEFQNFITQLLICIRGYHKGDKLNPSSLKRIIWEHNVHVRGYGVTVEFLNGLKKLYNAVSSPGDQRPGETE